MASSWRMEVMCDNCPFQKRGAGLRLRRSLQRGRWAGILSDLRNGGNFHCHKTVESDGDGDSYPTSDSKLCAGALAYQARQGASSNFSRICERLDAMNNRQTEVSK